MTARTPTVSIGLPVYNGAGHLGATLDSLLAQTFEDFELIISDNASTDDTEAICRDYTKADPRVHYHRVSQNLGAPRNYRRAFELSRSPYFKWANADDLVAPTLLERCLEVLRSDLGVVLAYPKTQLIDGSGSRIADYEDNLHLVSTEPAERFIEATERIRLCNVIYGVMRSDLLRQTRLMGSFIQADILFVTELALYGRFVEVPERLFFRRMHDGAFSSITDPARLNEFYNPQSKRSAALFHWRNLWESLVAVMRAPIRFDEKLRLVRYVGKRARWQRRSLAIELLYATRLITRRGIRQ